MNRKLACAGSAGPAANWRRNGSETARRRRERAALMLPVQVRLAAILLDVAAAAKAPAEQWRNIVTAICSVAVNNQQQRPTKKQHEETVLS